MGDQQEKKINYNPDFWTIGRKSRKNPSRSSESRKPKLDPVEDIQETNFSNQLSHLTNLINNTNNVNLIPSWGNLKNGKLPTYREYHGANNTTTPLSTNTHDQLFSQTSQPFDSPPESKYYLGRNKKKRTTKVRIQGKKSRRKIKKYVRELEQQSLTDIKNELYNNSLIKCGGDTPADVLKEMYKVSKLTGGIKNTNGEIMLHNFYSSENSQDDGGT